MGGVTVFEFDAVVAEATVPGCASIPNKVFTWLEHLCLDAAAKEKTSWLRLTQRQGKRAVQVTNFVGVMRAPNGFQIEVLPKIGKATNESEARVLLIQMLSCLHGFRHIRTENAELAAKRMPMLEVFIEEFLKAVDHIIKRGLRSDYITKRANLFALKGKLLMSQHLRHNLSRADRFFTEYDEFLPNRPENRLIHTALRQALSMSRSQNNQRLARELRFVFADIPESVQVNLDFQRVRLDRGMGYYRDALAWAKLILNEESPLTGIGNHHAPSLLFPMEAVFESFVEKHLAKQLRHGYSLKAQVRSKHLVEHDTQRWFQLRPDLLIKDSDKIHLVLDTKWKLLDASKNNGRDKYQLTQGDFYQLYAYGQHYLNGSGDMILIYPKTDAFPQPLPVFTFPQNRDLRLWVLPFCLKTKRLMMSEKISNALS